MDKKPLIIVCLCTVLLLVPGLLSNVVGYQSVKSTIMNESPLFSVRTQNAINQQKNILTVQYLGLGQGTLLQFPIRENRDELLKKIIEIINHMDDNTFRRFTEKCFKKIKLGNSFRDTTLNELLQVFYQLQKKPETSINTIISENNSQTGALILPTSGEITACGQWVPGCILKVILTGIVNFLIEIFQRPTVAWLCWHSGQVPCNLL